MNRLERWLSSGEWNRELTVRPCFSVQLHRCSSEKTLGPCVCRHLFTPTSLRCPACLCQAQPHSGSLQPMACWLASSLSLVLSFLPQKLTYAYTFTGLRRMLLTVFGRRRQPDYGPDGASHSMIRNRLAPPFRLPSCILTLVAPGSHRKLGDNWVNSCEKAEQLRQTGEGGAGGGKKKKESSGSTEQELQTTEGTRLAYTGQQCSSQLRWEHRRWSNMKDMEVGTKEQ